MKKVIFIGLLVTSLWSANNAQDMVLDFTTGENRFTIMVDGNIREYYVHVPPNYSKNTRTPVVFMLHGRNGNGLMTYNNSGWKELGEVENILTVYPSSWNYCISHNGQVKNTTRWNVFPVSYEYCENELPPNDIKFLRQIISELNKRFNVDRRRIYTVGFSNGGLMAFRCAVEMSDLIASIVASGGTYVKDTIHNPVRDLPITFQLGNSDDVWFGRGADVPLSHFDSLLNNHPIFKRIINVHTKSFNFESIYSISGDANFSLIATFKGIPDQGNRNFRFVFIEGLEHHYPNGINHPFSGAKQNWEWMKQFTVP